MPDQFQLLLGAILDNDPVTVRELLDKDALLARSPTVTARFETRIAHWVYAGDTALHVATAGHRVEIARMLPAAGADSGSAKNHRSSQPLHYAADGCLENKSWDDRQQVRMLEFLLKSAADIHAQDKNGATPLHRAVRTRCAAAVRCLLQAGSDATLRNKPGSTPFHLAVPSTGRGGSGAEEAKLAEREILQAFVERGISPSLKDARGKTVLEWAKSDWIRQALAGKRGTLAAHE